MEFELPKPASVLVEASTSVSSKKASQLFRSGFGASRPSGDADMANSFDVASVGQAGSYSNLSSSHTMELPAGKHTIYWKLQLNEGGELQLRGGGSMVVRAFLR